MGAADIPTSFGFPTFLRIFFPGFVGSVVYSYAFMPIIAGQKWASLTIEERILFWIISGVFLGLIIILFDFQIYQFLEGIQFWPQSLRKYKYKKTEEALKKTNFDWESRKTERKNERDVEKDKRDEEKIRELNYEILNLLSKIREFPQDPNMRLSKGRYPTEATRFGNVLAEYETYSERQYGMHMRVFWNHLWLLLPIDLQNDLDLKGSLADFPVYLTFIFISYAVIGSLGFLLQQELSLAASCFVGALMISVLFYHAAIASHKVYGRYIKAVFDLYRIDLAKKLDIKCSLIPSAEEIAMWQDYWHFLLDYKEPDSKRLYDWTKVAKR